MAWREQERLLDSARIPCMECSTKDKINNGAINANLCFFRAVSVVILHTFLKKTKMIVPLEGLPYKDITEYT